MTATPPSWGQTLSQEIAKPLPKGKGISPLVAGLVARVRGALSAFGWTHASARETETVEDHARMVLCELLERYREREVSRGVTKKAVKRVLNRARKELRHKHRENCVLARSEFDESLLLQSSSFFSPAIEQGFGLELLESLTEAEVISPAEYYFLLCKINGWTAEETGKPVRISQRTVRASLEAAEKRIEAHLQDEEEKITSSAPMTPTSSKPPSPERGRPRLSIPWDTLSQALKLVLEQ